MTARRRRGLSQDQLATASNINIGTIRKLEQGQRHSARLDTITALANALDLPISELLGVQPGFPPEANADVASLRTAIYDTTSTTEPASLENLHQTVGDLRAMYWHAKFGILAAHLPAHLAAVRSTVRAASSSEDRRAGQAELAKSLQLMASLVTHLSHEDLAQVALMQATVAAQEAEDPLLLAALHATTAWVLSRQGLYGPAQHLATTAAREIEPILSEASPDHIGVWGGLLHFGMAALAREGRDDEAHELLSLVQAAGHALRGREPDLYKTPFNATWSEHSAVQLAKDLDQPREVLRAARRVETPDKLPPSVHSRYLLNVAWASSLEWKSREALDALRKIDQIAPELIVHHGLARQIVEELMPRRRTQRLPGLLAIAERMGVIE